MNPNPESSQSNATFQQWAQEELREHRSGPLRIATGNTGGEVPLTTVDPDGYQDIVDGFLAQNAADYLPDTYTEEQIAGFEAQREQLAAMMADQGRRSRHCAASASQHLRGAHSRLHDFCEPG